MLKTGRDDGVLGSRLAGDHFRKKGGKAGSWLLLEEDDEEKSILVRGRSGGFRAKALI